MKPTCLVLSFSKHLFLFGCLGILTGCFIAPVATTVSYLTSISLLQSTAITGVSYVTTGKGVSDHVVSGITGQDCQVLNVINDKSICQAYPTDQPQMKNGSASEASPIASQEVQKLDSIAELIERQISIHTNPDSDYK